MHNAVDGTNPAPPGIHLKTYIYILLLHVFFLVRDFLHQLCFLKSGVTLLYLLETF